MPEHPAAAARRPLSRLTRRLGRSLAGAAAVATVALGAAACDSFIEPRPTDVLAPENFYRSATDAVAATNGVYEQTKWRHFMAYWFLTDQATDDLIASPNFGPDGHRASNYNFDSREWYVGDVWGSAYATINRANAVIDRVPAVQMDTTLRARLLGEARFLRANAYFDLVRFFGDVPLLRNEVKSLEALEIPRTPAAEVYQFIVADLQAAAQSLPASYGAQDLGRATAGAARALLAKVYLTQRDWARAAATAGEVIRSGTYRLNTDWRDNFRIARELTNPESIFEINFDVTANPGTGSVMMLFSLPSGFPGGDAYGLMQVTPSFTRQFAATDVRGNGGSFAFSGYVDAQGRRATWAVPAGAAPIKWLDQTSAQNMTSRGWQQQNNNWIVLRYADVLLMYAEAVNEGGAAAGLTAEAALNQVRTRAGIPAVAGLSQAAFRDSVRLERRRELFFEGHRWFDLSRWGTLDAAIRAKTTEVAQLFPGETTPRGTPSALLPIPQGEINVNPKLTQNPGW